MSKKNSAKQATGYDFTAKGGSGKSALALLMSSTAFRLDQLELLDADPANPSVHRFAGAKTKRV